MSEAQASFSLRNRNPDVLLCIANLSNDEVFTPPDLVNQMLDDLAKGWAHGNDGADIWADPSVTYLDPFTKTGVFLREITKRLTDGLAREIPDLEKRVDHILTKQVFGIAITEITSLIARRSLYCSKYANGEHSIVKSFDTEQGNIWFRRTEHSWVGGTEWIYTADERGNQVKQFTDGKCSFCGTRQAELDRGSDRETHAYAFIHCDEPGKFIEEIFGEKMQFDVVVGNPPYQLEDGGHGSSAAPIYQRFVEQAKTLEPRLLTMVIPSRWFSGGKGLDDFREGMLADGRVRSIDDYLTASEVFPSVGLKGGVCYFLWDRDNPGECAVTTHFKGWNDSSATRPMRETGADVFIRFNEGVSILKKVMKVETGQSQSMLLPESKRFEKLVSSRKPFGLDTTFKGKATKAAGDLVIHQNGGSGYTSRKSILAGGHLVDAWKIFIGRAAPGTGNKDTYPHRIVSTPFLGEPETISSETYLAIGPFDSRAATENALAYLSCRFTRLLILLHKPSADTTRRVYKFVPIQDWGQAWTDQLLYDRYGITEDEQAFIEKVVRPMELD